jgi:hypothetical protein
MNPNLKLRSFEFALIWAASVIASVGCAESGSSGEDSDACETGTERCECYRNDSCDKGLMCVSDVCVKESSADEDNDASSPDSHQRDARVADLDEEEDDETTSEDEQVEPTDEELPEAGTGTSSDDEEDTDPMDEPNPSIQQELNDGTVGSGCGQCDGELMCIEEVPGGYCTAYCTTNSECGTAGVCVGYMCFRACNEHADCRPNYACIELAGVLACDVGDPDDTGSDAEPGTCENTCEHYLTCKGLFDEGTQKTCEGNCESSGYSPEALAEFQATDCDTAIYMVEGPPSSEGGGSGGGTSDCDGCQWDGSSCVYLSQYTLVSTAGFTCDSSCCN